MLKKLSDEQLFSNIKRGDYYAFKYLFERYYSALCNYISSKFFTNDFIQEDVVQEVFIKIWEERKHIKITGSVKSYLYTAVKNRSLNRLKSESLRRGYTNKFFELKKFERSPINSIKIEQEEFRMYLFQCIEKLPPRCKEVFTQSRFSDLKQNQIAETLNISIKTVKAQISKALKLLRDCLQPIYPEYFK